MRNLAPHIKRQRLVFEGKRSGHIRSEEIVDYFLQLSDLLKMHTIGDVMTSLSPDEGWAGWIHWTTSGGEFMAWEEPDGVAFFTVDRWRPASSSSNNPARCHRIRAANS